MPPPAGLDEGLARPRRPRLAPLGWVNPFPTPSRRTRTGTVGLFASSIWE
jgi:hypothetical protein